MVALVRHGHELRFDESGFAEVPYVYRPLAAGGVYEEPFLEHIRGLGLVGQYLDVGAHLGTHTVWFATLCPSTHVHAIEPVSRYAEVIERNVAANNLAGKVTVHRCGAADRRGQASNWLCAEHQIGFGEPAGVTESFPVVRLDRLVRGPVAVIKLDVEGMESIALAGATRILSRYRPAVFAEARSADDLAAVAEVLGPFGYRRSAEVWNSSPTYEFLAPPTRVPALLRPVWRHTPVGLRRTIRSSLRGPGAARP